MSQDHTNYMMFYRTVSVTPNAMCYCAHSVSPKVRGVFLRTHVENLIELFNDMPSDARAELLDVKRKQLSELRKVSVLSTLCDARCNYPYPPHVLSTL